MTVVETGVEAGVVEVEAEAEDNVWLKELSEATTLYSKL